MKTWEEIRSQWVNGERSESRDDIYQLTTHKAMRVVRQAILKHVASLPAGTSRSGDLCDLLEIIESYGKPENRE